MNKINNLNISFQEILLITQIEYKSLYTKSSIKFFLRYPEAFSLIVNNLHLSHYEISSLLRVNNICNNGNIYSRSTISRLTCFIRDVREYKLTSSNLKKNKNV